VPGSRLNNVYILLTVLQGMLLGHMDNLIVSFTFYYYRRVLITIISISIQDRAGQYSALFVQSN